MKNYKNSIKLFTYIHVFKYYDNLLVFFNLIIFFLLNKLASNDYALGRWLIVSFL